MAEPAGAAAFAAVYDVLYAGDEAFLAAQVAFFRDVFGNSAHRVLDAGCGTGRHLLALGRLGYPMIGVDSSAAMLKLARGKSVAAGLTSELVLCDLRHLPFAPGCDGILCVESPLAYLLSDADLAVTLESFNRCLAPGGNLIVDVFDYVATLGAPGVRGYVSRFPLPGSRGMLSVRESHEPDPVQGLWLMRQEFRVHRGELTEQFCVEHRLRLRNAAAYCRALAGAGFGVKEVLTFYPATPAELVHERRMIIVASKMNG